LGRERYFFSHAIENLGTRPAGETGSVTQVSTDSGQVLSFIWTARAQTILRKIQRCKELRIGPWMDRGHRKDFFLATKTASQTGDPLLD
jgi:hypothetical protein